MPLTPQLLCPMGGMRETEAQEGASSALVSSSCGTGAEETGGARQGALVPPCVLVPCSGPHAPCAGGCHVLVHCAHPAFMPIVCQAVFLCHVARWCHAIPWCPSPLCATPHPCATLQCAMSIVFLLLLCATSCTCAMLSADAHCVLVPIIPLCHATCCHACLMAAML